LRNPITLVGFLVFNLTKKPKTNSVRKSNKERMLKLTLSLILILASLNSKAQQEIEWKKISPEIFEQAQKENKIILLNLEANWCHWCHVMHDSTYSNSKIIDFLEKYFICVKADQDAHPELAVRYKDYGWPATIFLNSKGEDVVKRRGYIAPERYLKLLKSIVADPSPEELTINYTSSNNSESDNQSLIRALEEQFLNSLDYEMGGFDQDQKFVENDTYEYAVFGSKNPKVKQWIEKSIHGAKQLSDPVWGGIYQYSTHDDWQHLHYEKLLAIQARYIRIFALNFLYNNDASSIKYAERCVEYINRFLLDESGLYKNAQDADLNAGEHAGYFFELNNEERLKLGIPKVDQHTYTHNNAEIAQSLLLLHQATSNEAYLNQAIKILSTLINQRKNENGLFNHSAENRSVVSLKDNLAVVDLFVQCVKFFPNDIVYHAELKQLLLGIKNNFVLENGSFCSFSGKNGLEPLPIISENIRLSRLMNWYGHTFQQDEYIKLAKNCFQFLCQSGLVDPEYSEPALLLLATELVTSPLEHVLMQTNKATDSMESTMKSLAPFYCNFVVQSKDSLPINKKEYFESFNQNVLLICTDKACSSPMYTSNDILLHYQELYKFKP